MSLTQNQLRDHLDALFESMDVIAPTRDGDRVYFRLVTKSNEIAWDYTTSVNSIKEFFFPQR